MGGDVQVTLAIIPVTLKEANDFVRLHHRHNRPVVGAKFAVGVQDETGTLVGVAIVGRPTSPKIDQRVPVEITRLCTDGTRNACSILYAAARRAARAMGHCPVYTYTLPEEGGCVIARRRVQARQGRCRRASQGLA